MRHYIQRHITLAEDLVNTYDFYLEQPEKLRTPGDLKSFLERHTIVVDEELSEEALHEVRTFREQLRAIFTTPHEEEAAHLLNDLMRSVRLQLTLVCEEDHTWHTQLHPEPENSPIQRLCAEAILGLSYAMEHYGKARLGFCAAQPCRDVFIDTSRNGTRRYCDDRCANRHNVAAFRARQG